MTRRADGRWRIAWALAISQTVGFGVLYYAYAVLTLPMEHELGWSRAQTSGAFSLALLVAGLAAWPAGRWVDRRGARRLMTLGSGAAALLLVAWSFVTSLPGLYLVQAAIGLAMAASLYEIAFAALARRFRNAPRLRIRALLIVTAMGGLASTIFVPLATALVEGLGWRAALRVLAALLAATALPLHAFALRSAPPNFESDPSPDTDVDARAALRSPLFWWLSGAFGFDRIALVAIAAHGVPLLLERGHPPALVAAAVGSIGVMQVAGRLLFAPAAERAGLAPLAIATFALRGAALLVLLVVPGSVGVWVFAALFGIANGATTLARAGLVADAFGATHYGSVAGAMATLVALAQTAGPLAVGALRERAGGYTPALALLLTLTLIAALAAARAAVLLPRVGRTDAS